MDARARREDREPGLDLEAFLPYRLSVLANKVSRGLARLYQRRFGVTPPQWRVIAVLARFPDVSASDVAEKTAMDKVMVSRALAGLVARGCVLRRLDAGDRRRSTLRLSARGLAIYRQIAPLALAYEGELMATLSPADQAALDRLLAALTARAEG